MCVCVCVCVCGGGGGGWGPLKKLNPYNSSDYNLLTIHVTRFMVEIIKNAAPSLPREGGRKNEQNAGYEDREGAEGKQRESVCC